MAGDELDLSEFEEFSKTAKERARSRTSDPTGGSGGGGGEKRARRGKRRRWPWFLAGLILGVAGAVFAPDLAAPYLPRMLQAGGEEVTGPVVGKRVGDDRVLLTVDTERGALLATFRQRVPEIDLLVEEGDTVTLGIPAYAPLIEDPVLASVRKGPGSGARGAPTAEEPGATSAPTTSPGPPVPDTISGTSTEADSAEG